MKNGLYLIPLVLLFSGCTDGQMDAVVLDTSSAETVKERSAMGKVRKPAVAGAFYDGDSGALKVAVQKCLHEAKDAGLDGRLVGAVVPHAGYVYSGRCAGSVYRLIKKGAYKRIMILGPSHHYPFSGIIVPGSDIAAHRTPLGDVPIDQDVCRALLNEKGFTSVAGADSREHSIEVQLPFLQMTAGDFKLVPLLCGAMSDTEIDNFVKVLVRHIDDETLLLVSSDFTHYGRRFGYLPFEDDLKKNIYKFLTKATGLIADLDTEGFNRHLQETSDTICGRTPIRILMSVIQHIKPLAKGKPLDLYCSGDVMGGYDNSVSYGAIGFFERTR